MRAFTPPKPVEGKAVMATNTRHRRRAYRFITILGILLAAGGIGAAALTQPAAGQASVSMGNLSIADATTTANGTVSDVRLDADVAWEYDVPDAERRILELSAGPSGGTLEVLDFRQTETTAGQDSGTVTFDVSLLDASGLSASDFDPPIAGTQTTDVTVEARVEVRRAGGDAVVRTVRDTVTVTVNDGETLSAGVGGTGTVTVVA